jgi:transcription elongation factor/antiterminator RfaH
VTTTPSLQWYVVRAKAKQDARAETNLSNWGVETFAPRVREYRRLPGGVDVATVGLLFPSYMFARFDASGLLTKVRLTRGVHSVVGLGECVTPIEPSIIDLIKSRMDDKGLVRLSEPAPGDRVTIVTGPLATMEGIFERHCANERVVILLANVLSGARVEMARSAIHKASVAWTEM